MSEIKTGGPAFPSGAMDMQTSTYVNHNGMTLRQYAAIKLKVPDSGTDWLDEMIVKSLRNDFAAKALAAPYAHHESNPDIAALWAYQLADAMIKAREAK